MKKTLIAFCITLLFLVPLASASTTMKITPASEILEVGDTFNITITVKPTEEVDTIAIDLLQWTTGVIDCISVTKGDIFSNPLIWMPGKINNTIGKLQFLVMASDSPTTIENELCTITFKATSEGISTIAIKEAGIARNGTSVIKQIINSCQLTVGNAYIPPSNNNNTTNSTNTTNTTTQPTNQTTNQTTNTTQPTINETNNNSGVVGKHNNTVKDKPATTIHQDNITDAEKKAVVPGFFDNIPPSTIIYVIVAIIIISISSYIIVHHLQRRQDEDEARTLEPVDVDATGNYDDVWG